MTKKDKEGMREEREYPMDSKTMFEVSCRGNGDLAEPHFACLVFFFFLFFLLHWGPLILSLSLLSHALQEIKGLLPIANPCQVTYCFQFQWLVSVCLQQSWPWSFFRGRNEGTEGSLKVPSVTVAPLPVSKSPYPSGLRQLDRAAVPGLDHQGVDVMNF